MSGVSSSNQSVVSGNVVASSNHRGDSQKKVELVCRVALAAIGIVAMLYTQSDIVVSAILATFLVSSGVTALVGGVVGLGFGVTLVVHALATGSLFSLGVGLICGNVGKHLIECHDDAPIGMFEPAIQWVGREGAKLFV